MPDAVVAPSLVNFVRQGQKDCLLSYSQCTKDTIDTEIVRLQDGERVSCAHIWKRRTAPIVGEMTTKN